jgi:hypothetical protein
MGYAVPGRRRRVNAVALAGAARERRGAGGRLRVRGGVGRRGSSWGRAYSRSQAAVWGGRRAQPMDTADRAATDNVRSLIDPLNPENFSPAAVPFSLAERMPE